jgi:hypothetical protein
MFRTVVFRHQPASYAAALANLEEEGEEPDYEVLQSMDLPELQDLLKCRRLGFMVHLWLREARRQAEQAEAAAAAAPPAAARAAPPAAALGSAAATVAQPAAAGSLLHLAEHGQQTQLPPPQQLPSPQQQGLA